MVTLSAFADEIHPDLTVQMDELEKNGIRYIELRGVDGKNVKDLGKDEVKRIKEQLDQRGFGISSIGSPIGKIGIQDDFGPHFDDFKRIVDTALALSSKYIRIFSFFIPAGDDPKYFRDDVMERISRFVEYVEGTGVILLHENEKGIYGDTGERNLDILRTIDSPLLRAVFDPANYVQCKEHPYEDCFTKVQEYVAYVHIKDALLENGRVVPAGAGDGDVKRVLAELFKAGFDGFLSLEPHLQAAGTMSGFSGPDLFKVAVDALKSILKELDVMWS
ncbi:MAG: sugar phosphate isomerase/epimerase [Limnochordia bacterium]|jgi:sugar phosphate isomerase/epimerase|nr:sugar phosphate isomerase/epimerase [Limnochordia bacterium]MDD2628590.1 sugar phosphate isomerase/epimerase [Limnochordia bacterium]MDD4517342.1 sugar phosphate isomerase/epimerase [Limnochordia bacterium]